jgi:hypothetical protein
MIGNWLVFELSYPLKNKIIKNCTFFDYYFCFFLLG